MPPPSGCLHDLLDLLATTVGEDWTGPAGNLTWSVADTVDHLCDVAVWYAIQLAVGATGPTRIDATPPGGASNADRVDALAAAGSLLETVADAVPVAQRAWHRFGMTGPAEIRLMFTAETLVHGHDIAAGLGLAWQPDDEASLTVLHGLFPDLLIDADPWPLLLWAHGRLPLPGRGEQTSWVWQVAP